MTEPNPVDRFAELPTATQELLLALAKFLPTVPRRQPELKPCGTWAAYKRHHRNGEEPCEPCREASRARDRRRKRRPAAPAEQSSTAADPQTRRRAGRAMAGAARTPTSSGQEVLRW